MVYCEVMFDKETSGEIAGASGIHLGDCDPQTGTVGVPVANKLRSDKTYLDLFAETVTRGPKRPSARIPSVRALLVQRDCKLRPIRI